MKNLKNIYGRYEDADDRWFFELPDGEEIEVTEEIVNDREVIDLAREMQDCYEHLVMLLTEKMMPN